MSTRPSFALDSTPVPGQPGSSACHPGYHHLGVDKARLPELNSLRSPHCRGLEKAEDRRSFQGSGRTLSGIDKYAEIDYLVAAESRLMIHADGSFLVDRVW